MANAIEQHNYLKEDLEEEPESYDLRLIFTDISTDKGKIKTKFLKLRYINCGEMQMLIMRNFMKNSVENLSGNFNFLPKIPQKKKKKFKNFDELSKEMERLAPKLIFSKKKEISNVVKTENNLGGENFKKIDFEKIFM